MGAAIEFWFEFASTYSYPAAMRVERLAQAAGVEVAWRPFLLGPLFNEQQGLTDSPFNAFPVKGRYMWRDLERVCEAEALPMVRPSQFPRNGLLAARIATAGLARGWTPAFTRLVYQANFAHDEDISRPEVLAPLVSAAGGDAEAALAAAASDPVKAQLKAHVEEARARGVFGAPSFITADGELFWGNDRLEQALDWAVQHDKTREIA